MNKNTGTVPDGSVNCHFTFFEDLHLSKAFFGAGRCLRGWVVYGDGLILICFICYIPLFPCNSTLFYLKD